MICAACAQSTDSDSACSACGQPPLLDGRYRLEAIVGRGASGTTYRAHRLEDGAQVAIKELLLRSMDSFKTEELFRREAEVLRSLDHPGVPRYHEHMTLGSGKQTGFYLVQEFIEGGSLEAEIAGKRLTEAEIIAMVIEILEVLAWLHAFRPPVIHRDIKLGNIMRRPADGRLVLVDFGSVRDAVVDAELGGSTVAGTFGYMAPEQFAGRAVPASDLYAVGATAVALLTRRDPQSLVGDDQRLDWEPVVYASEGLKSVLRDLLERDLSRRASDAAAIARRLEAVVATGEDPQARPSPLAPAAAPAAGEVVLWVDPPPAPRDPPSLTMSRQAPGAAFKLLFGSIFGGVGGTLGLVFTGVAIGTGEWLFGLIGPFIGLLFGGIGGVFFTLGLKKVRSLRRVWRHGEVVQGSVMEVRRDHSIRVNNRSPLLLTYRFEAGGKRRQGAAHSWDEGLLDARKGTPLAVLVDPSDPEQNLPYL